MSNWTCLDAEPQPDLHVGGDGACESVSMRFQHVTEPAIVTVYSYVVDVEDRQGINYDPEYCSAFDYEEQVHYAVYGSHDEMDAGEPIWEDYTYENPSLRGWTFESDAEDYRDAEAGRWLSMGAEGFIAWDGKVPA